MTKMTRRGLIGAGIAGAAAGGLLKAGGLIPPDGVGWFGLGETLDYAAHKLITRNAPAREFPRSAVSKPFPNEIAHAPVEIADWKLTIDGMVAKPLTLSVADVRALPRSSQTTQLACEEGWSYIAEWTGAALSEVLKAAGLQRGARWVVYYSVEKDWWESVDIDEAMHPQTIVATDMNGAPIPVPFGGPLRIRVPRQLGYKSVKFITQISVTDNIRKFGKGLGSASPEGGYAWYAGI